MAIKVTGTTVIDNSRVLQNITGANGVYNNFHPASTAITSVIDFSTPFMTLTMSGNVTFTESNKSAGRTAILILNTNSTPFAPTFSANIKWPAGGTAPTWSTYRYWEISFVCWDATIVRAVSAGFSA